MKTIHCFCHIVVVVAVVFLFTAATGCNTIMESREECPCELTIDFSKIDGNVRNVQLWLFDSEGDLLYKDTVGRKSFKVPDVLSVKKGNIYCYVWCNLSDASVCTERFSPSTIIEKAGALSADSLFFFKYEGPVRGESVILQVLPNKEFATINVRFSGVEEGDGAGTELVSPSGGFFVNGKCLEKLSVISVNTIQSQYQMSMPNCASRLNDDGNCLSFRMLRQSSLNGIYMNIYSLSGEKEMSRREIGTFELGKYLKDSNYDMEAVSLKDIDILIDMSSLLATVKIGDWIIMAPITIDF
ncbi:MAG TPA: FimB/Mfa2 family fimbrial subunit [Candidatus Egerieousia sp.]|nr:FimB/Mfa2 family fimbrial subunit [Candidatus Egerieousia sp.]